VWRVWQPSGPDLADFGSHVANVKDTICFAYKVRDFAASENGNVFTKSSGITSLAAGVQFNIGYGGNGGINGHIGRIQYFKSRLGDAEVRARAIPS
jgi:hypothetical protein